MRVFKRFILWGLGLTPAETQTTEAERACLARHAAGKKRLAEIGVYHAVTTQRLRQAMAPDGIFLAIDPFPPDRLGFSYDRIIAHREAARVPNGRLHWLRMTGEQAARDATVTALGGVDFLFIDGDHSYEAIRGDWEAWSPLIALDGVVALHDSCSPPGKNIDSAGSVAFTRDVILKDDRFVVVEAVDTLTVLRRAEPAH
jgi:hypothetical protein